MTWLEYMSAVITPGMLVFDIGAHSGMYTLNYLLMGACVLAVEPQEKVLAHLIDRVAKDKRVNASNLKTLCVACGAEPGTAEMALYYRCNLASLAPDKWSTSRMRTHVPNEIVTVPVVTLDALIDKYGMPGFMKVDVEYYEPQVFTGLSKPVPWMCYEYTREQMGDARVVADHLQTIGDYEFSFGFGRDAPGAYMTKDIGAMFAQLDRIDDPGLWGDIYARLAQ